MGNSWKFENLILHRESIRTTEWNWTTADGSAICRQSWSTVGAVALERQRAQRIWPKTFDVVAMLIRDRWRRYGRQPLPWRQWSTIETCRSCPSAVSSKGIGERKRFVSLASALITCGTYMNIMILWRIITVIIIRVGGRCEISD